VRQAKRGASGRGHVPAAYGLTNHACRVWPRCRRQRSAAPRSRSGPRAPRRPPGSPPACNRPVSEHHAEGAGLNAPEADPEGARWCEPRGAAGGHDGRGMRGQTRQARGRPSRRRPRLGDARQASPGLRRRSHGRGTPDPDGGRSLHEAEAAADRAPPGGPPEAGRPKAWGASAQPSGLGGRASRPPGAGADRPTEPAQATGTGQAGAETPGTPPGRAERRRPRAQRRRGCAPARGGSPRRGSRTAGARAAQRPPPGSLRSAHRPTSRTWQRTAATWGSHGSGSATGPPGSDGTRSPPGTAS
jgi:hypothetical protein